MSRLTVAHVRRTAVTGMAALVLVGCASTTYDQSLATTTPATSAVATTTTLPSGTPAELMPDKDPSLAARDVDAVWAALRPEVAKTRADLVDAFDQSIDRINRAVQFKRVADADKSTKNLEVLIASYQG